MPKREKPAIITEIGIYYSEVKGKARMISAEKLKSMALDNERMINAFCQAYGCDRETAVNVMLNYICEDSASLRPDGLAPAEVQPWEGKEAPKKRGKQNEKIQETKRD